MIIITNRSVNELATDETMFGETPNAKGIDEIRLAKADYDAQENRWNLQLIPEPDSLDPNNLPTQELFNEVVNEIAAGTYGCNWLFWVHGFNMTTGDVLESARQRQEKYDLEVIIFTWPSNPGGFVTNEYDRSRQAAKASANAFDRALEKLGKSIANRPLPEIERCRVSLNLEAHSMGNFLLENYVRDPIFSGETRIFDNVILHQADVDVDTHTQWIDKITAAQRIYVTINESDAALKVSDVVNRPRLGRSLYNLRGMRPVYCDFSMGSNVRAFHNLALEVQDNRYVDTFWSEVYSGRRGEVVEGFQYDSNLNVYKLLK
ncbi:MAG: alpha/beta hydrolase [Symploca sp. SIO3C6]|uniref:Alpha/beta hydrolase n=1 Tax=Symploca sp. SIO1C4 TaxID=2607765 RepID=A0A6B3N0H9_9CYAN|nr:alpha/beta hydrolase [Symploca sp. SIO3C6]NER27196.1 alpha/beta hydrolase [Symploca sp. SIO1C4]NET04668.1 alpha/beta hydrolase [Symploca sp. SIO2B6]NET47199.1 alpha/beta hydrolase [Merismopedia sp. SIO2A8]